MGVGNGQYRYADDLLALEACTPPRRRPALWLVYQSPIIVQNFVPLWTDKELARYIYDGFTRGFRIEFNRESELDCEQG